ncbi:MAG TPA: Asp-tRNA(Asn)/Glu-tRNA(Gln) amidotransferase subunit GatC [Firmicutes bacterium]|nr:Asp-tRNA(Asn)/Glu-tRNA(Gln) amidotransferase subunit GatC [Bacillota bacterium]
MKIDLKTVERIARLSQLSFNDEEKKALAGELSAIIAYANKLEELDISGIAPSTQGTATKNVFRSDSAVRGDTWKEALENAPDRKENYFKVPSIPGIDN